MYAIFPEPWFCSGRERNEMIRTPARLAILVVLLAVAAGAFIRFGRPIWNPVYVKITGGRTVSDAIRQHGANARSRLSPGFASAGISYPPPKAAFLCLKAERVLEVWAERGGKWSFVTRYPILAASGVAGPKLREGDLQVPEGVYRIASLNPNSSYHLSMQVDYPNEFDLRHAQKEGRKNPGGAIFIHGSNASIGCIAVGDQAIEDLFVLVAETGKENVTVLITPQDPRTGPLPRSIPNAPAWLPEVYDRLEDEFGRFTRRSD